MQQDLKYEALSLKHLLNHTPDNPWRTACMRAKMTRRPARQNLSSRAPLEKFGELVNADHLIAQSEESQGLTGERDALLIVDRYSGYVDAFPLKTKSADDAYEAFVEYFGDYRPKDVYIWSDSAHELVKAVKTLKVPHGRGTPGRHQGNAFCESMIRRAVEGARSLLEFEGFPACYWVFAIRHWCFCHNVEITNGDSPWNRRHGEGNWTGPLLPFGATVDFMDRPNHVKELGKFEPRASIGLFVGFHLQPGGRWSKEHCVFRKRDFEQFDFTKPRTLNELRPVRTQECKITTAVPEFMLKAPYDVARRTLSQHALIRIDEPVLDQDVVVDEAPAAQEDPPDEPEVDPSALHADPRMHELRPDAQGKMYAYDQYGNRLYRQPLKGTQRPPEIPAAYWRNLRPDEKRDIIKHHRELLAAADKVVPEAVSEAASSSAPVASAASWLLTIRQLRCSSSVCIVYSTLHHPQTIVYDRAGPLRLPRLPHRLLQLLRAATALW